MIENNVYHNIVQICAVILALLCSWLGALCSLHCPARPRPSCFIHREVRSRKRYLGTRQKAWRNQWWHLRGQRKNWHRLLTREKSCSAIGSPRSDFFDKHTQTHKDFRSCTVWNMETPPEEGEARWRRWRSGAADTTRSWTYSRL